MATNKNNSLTKHYVSLFFVVIAWGLSPLFTKYMYQYNSASIHTAFSQAVAVLSLLIINAKKLKFINKDLLKTAELTGFVLGLANILQKIGFQYTTPSNYAFLENLSVVVVPVLAFVIYKKRPTIMTVIACVACLVGCAVLCNLFSGFAIKSGDILCAIAGALYGVNIAVTGAKAKKFRPGLYILVQLTVGAIISLITALALNFITVNGAPLERMKFTFEWHLILMSIGVVLITNTLCWVLRTNALKHVNSTIVAVTMPLSAVITSVLSVALGQDKFSLSLGLGAGLIFIAVILSGVNDARDKRTQNYTFEIADKQKLTGTLPAVFEITYENMTAIIPSDNDKESDYLLWKESVIKNIESGNTRYVLFYRGEKIIGYFQYRVENEFFCMDEMQIIKDEQGSGVFRKVFAFLLPTLPDSVTTAVAYANKRNEKSRNILLHLGFSAVGESASGNSIRYEGDYSNLKEKYCKFS
ncbi:MAG: DMT family transporter [Clostridia bacterium]|nr:DMT family transporter [Clostridia bacterium]